MSLDKLLHDRNLRLAAEHGHAQIVASLCGDGGMDPAAHDNYALRIAARHGHTDVVKYLCGLPPDRGVDPAAC